MKDRLEIETRRFRTPNLDGLVSMRTDPTALAKRYGLSYEEQDALELEAANYAKYGCHRSRVYCFTARDLASMDPLRIKAYRRHVEDEYPEWLEQVKLATLIENRAEDIVNKSGVPPYPAIAILYNLIDRDELPDEFTDA